MSSLAMREWRTYRPNVDIFVENKDYTVKTASTWREWYAALRFRREVFVADYLGGGINLPFRLDIDRFDWSCDQLIVTSKTSGQIIGCYRILCSLFTDNFYSETEFDMSHVKKMPGVKIELGRACVHSQFRNGSVIQILWRGIAEYVKATQAEYAFGCTSVKSVDPVTARKLELYLQEKEAHTTWPFIAPLPQYQFRESERREQSRILMLEDYSREEILRLVPPLLKAYLRLGAKFCGPAAIDRKFNCLDFFTLFDFTKLSQQMKARYDLA